MRKIEIYGVTSIKTLADYAGKDSIGAKTRSIMFRLSNCIQWRLTFDLYIRLSLSDNLRRLKSIKISVLL